MKKQHVILVGAGLAGSLLAIYLAKRGFQVDIYERRPDMRQASISAGRSINLALSVRGIHALSRVNLDQRVLADALPMTGRMMHAVDGQLTYQPYGKNENEVINSISRRGLNCLLMDTAESENNVRIFFNQRCLGGDLEAGQLIFRDEARGETRTVSGDTIIATDGATSAVRMEMQKIGRFNLSQMYLEHGYKELTIPPGAGGSFQIDKNMLHIWPRGDYMLIALPNPDGSFTCTLFLGYASTPGFDGLKTPADVLQFFQEIFPDTIPLIPELSEDFFSNPTGNLITIKCLPWHIDGKVLLLGDAAHAIVPFYGQGMNCAFEDCAILDDCISEYGTDWARVYQAYQEKRKADADAIADLALENFIEMRDSVANPTFLLKRKAELLLEEKYPGKFLSKYSMVSFHRTAYAAAMKKGRIQDSVLMEMCEGLTDIDQLDLDLAFNNIQQRLSAEAESNDS